MTPTYDLVIRFRLPNLWGRRCRIVNHGGLRRDRTGRTIPNSGDNYVALELDDGEVITAVRSAVVQAASLPGRQAIAKAARGGVRLGLAKKREARAARMA